MQAKKTFPEPQPFTNEDRPQIAMNAVESSQVKCIGYDDATKTLAVVFARGTGAIYHYPNVERETFDQFVGAESIGTFFGKHIKPLPFKKFAPEEQPA